MPLRADGASARMALRERSPKLFTPLGFDYSPYFEIIKYPMFGFDELAIYQQLPWILKNGVESIPIAIEEPRTSNCAEVLESSNKKEALELRP